MLFQLCLLFDPNDPENLFLLQRGLRESVFVNAIRRISKQLRLFGSLTSLTLCGIALVAQSSAPNAQKPSETPKTVHQLFVEDQDDTHGPDGKPRFTEEEYLQRVKVRQATLREMLAAGEIKTGDDFRDASYIFQHSDKPDDCLFAHILAMEAVFRGTTAARFIAAATLDRYLQFTKQPQVFGTQYITDPKAPIPIHTAASPFQFGRTLEPYNESFLPDAVRTDFCVPILAQQHANVALFNTGKWPRETMHPPCQ
jgi:hypothetical protein